MVKYYRDRNGYPRFADSGRLVHRWKAEQKLARPLRKGEVVHHKNRCKTDYSDNNLWVCKNQKQHESYHKRDRKKTGFW